MTRVPLGDLIYQLNLRIPMASREDMEALQPALEEGKPAEWLESREARQPSLSDQERVE